MDKKVRIVTAAWVIGIAIVVIIAIFINMSKSASQFTLYTSPLNVVVTPENDEMKSISSGQSIEIGYGTHTIQVGREGFVSQTLSVTINEGDPAPELYVVLTPESAEAKSLMSSEKEDYNQQFIATTRANKLAEQAYDEYPILNHLPYYGRLFTIAQTTSELYPDTPGAIALYIEAFGPKEKRAALDVIREKGFDPSDYEIIFGQYEYKTRDQED